MQWVLVKTIQLVKLTVTNLLDYIISCGFVGVRAFPKEFSRALY